MKGLHRFIRQSILNLIDFFYPLFKKIMPLQTFRYAVCGGGNTVLNLLLFSFTYNFILHKEVVYLPFMAIKPHVAAYMIAFLITFPIGFYLSLFVVFTESHLRKRVQLFRYLLVVLTCLLLNYVLLRLFVEVLGWYPTPAMIVNTILVVSFSYTSQRYFSFQVAKNEKKELTEEEQP